MLLMPITQTSDNNDITIVGGTDATVIGNSGNRLLVDALVSSSNTTLIDGTLTTYSASAFWTFAASATDIFTITGSASKLVKIRRITLSFTATSGANATVVVTKRSTANSGGTSVVRDAVPWDSANTAATATVRTYTANPTLGTLVGNVQTSTVYASGGGTIGSIPIILDYTGTAQQPMILRGTTQVLGINMNGTTYTGNVARATVIWTEE
jgi:hypothetical protein